MRLARWLPPIALVALALATAGSASATSYLKGGGHLLDLRRGLDESGVPTRLDTDRNWLRCAHSEAPMDDRAFTGFDLATPDRLEDSGRFSELSSGFRFAVRYRIEARRIGAERWKGSFELVAKEFYRGSRIGTCVRQDRRALWQVGGS